MCIYWNYLNNYIYFFVFFDSLYLILNIVVSVEKFIVIYFVIVLGK